MASYHQNGNDLHDRDQKISGFSKRLHVEQAEENAVESGRSAKSNGKKVFGRRNGRFWLSLLVDLILLAVLAGVVVGCVFGYRALRDLYAPEWETREVVFCVKMENIPPDMVKFDQEKVKYAIVDNPIWSSEKTDADQLGTVVDVRTVLVTTGDVNTVTLYLEVEATAYYREGKGYRMGETMLLAGTEGTYRLEGLTAYGTMISMHEKADETQETTPAPVDPEHGMPGNADPGAQG